MYGEDGWTQVAEPSEAPGFSYGVGTEGEFHIDGTPLRTVVIVGIAIFILIGYVRGDFRFHVVG